MTGIAVSRRTAKGVGGLVTAVILGGAVVAIGYAVNARPRPSGATGPTVATGTFAVARGTVTEQIRVAGNLGYEGSYSVVNQLPAGILTSAANPGSTVDRGGTLYAVTNQPVRLLFGTTPAYRDFAAGMTDGPDVLQLEQNLVALGLDPGHQITVDNHFTTATAAAIRRWQDTWGLPTSQRTGTLLKGQVVFLPGMLRVSQIRATIGMSVGPDTPVLSGSSTSRVVTAQIATERQTLVHPGDRVVVSLSGVADVPSVQGTITRIGQAAAVPSEPAAPNSTTAATVPFTVGLTLPPGSPELDKIPVQVTITTASHQNVLLVPVTALLARSGGGYQLRLTGNGYIEVQPGLFDETAGMVEVDGAGLSVGQQVEVPAP